MQKRAFYVQSRFYISFLSLPTTHKKADTFCVVFFAEVISFQSGSSNLVTSGELHSRLFCWQYSTPVSQKQLRSVCAAGVYSAS